MQFFMKFFFIGNDLEIYLFNLFYRFYFAMKLTFKYSNLTRTKYNKISLRTMTIRLRMTSLCAYTEWIIDMYRHLEPHRAVYSLR